MPPHPRRLACAVAAIGLLAGCAGQGVRPSTAILSCAPHGDADVPEGACTGALAALDAQAAAEESGGQAWSLQGRVAISTGRQGGSARIEWLQPGPDRYRVILSAPLTRQSWRLVVEPGQAELDGLDGGSRRGSDAAALLHDATGWDVPLESLRYWVRGLPAPGPVSSYRFDAANTLVGLEQSGWHIGFFRATPAGRPSRIEAERGDSRVRLLIDLWGDATGE